MKEVRDRQKLELCYCSGQFEANRFLECAWEREKARCLQSFPYEKGRGEYSHQKVTHQCLLQSQPILT